METKRIIKEKANPRIKGTRPVHHLQMGSLAVSVSVAHNTIVGHECRAPSSPEIPGVAELS